MRDDLINSAVTFLKDPQVANAPLAKRISFLESKELTQDEIQEALKRAAAAAANSGQESENEGGGSTTVSSSQRVSPYAAEGPAYYPAQPPPPPKRDWRDLFVMATVSVGVSYGLYVLAKRYVLPRILPPTPPALQADKDALAEEFAKAQVLLEQLQADTEELKRVEKEKVQQIDHALGEVEKTIESIKSQSDRRALDIKNVKSEVESIRENIPKALDKIQESQNSLFIEMQSELKSLKQLMATRLRIGTTSSGQSPGTPNTVPPIGNAADSSSASGSAAKVGSTSGSESKPLDDAVPTTSKPPNQRAAAIPAWQLAAANQGNNSSPSSNTNAEPSATS